jgi:hypothetical protein
MNEIKSCQNEISPFSKDNKGDNSETSCATLDRSEMKHSCENDNETMRWTKDPKKELQLQLSCFLISDLVLLVLKYYGTRFGFSMAFEYYEMCFHIKRNLLNLLSEKAKLDLEISTHKRNLCGNVFLDANSTDFKIVECCQYTTISYFYDDFATKCKNLVSLSLQLERPKEVEILDQLLQNNPNLVHLRLDCDGNIDKELSKVLLQNLGQEKVDSKVKISTLCLNANNFNKTFTILPLLSCVNNLDILHSQIPKKVLIDILPRLKLNKLSLCSLPTILSQTISIPHITFYSINDWNYNFDAKSLMSLNFERHYHYTVFDHLFCEFLSNCSNLTFLNLPIGKGLQNFKILLKAFSSALSCCKNLTTLKLDCINKVWITHLLTNVSLKFLWKQLLHLEITIDYGSLSLFTFLLPSMKQITRLYLKIHTTDFANIVSYFCDGLVSCSSTLEELSVQVCHVDHIAKYEDVLKILPKLKNLVLLEFPIMSSFVPHFLDQILPRCVDHLLSCEFRIDLLKEVAPLREIISKLNLDSIVTIYHQISSGRTK